MILVDSNVLIDLSARESPWRDWSATRLAEALGRGPVLINPIVYAEVSVSYSTPRLLDKALNDLGVERAAVPFDAGFLAGRAFASYRRNGGQRARMLPDFLIAAHAAVHGLALLTRDPGPCRTYFPTVAVIAPE